MAVTTGSRLLMGIWREIGRCEMADKKKSKTVEELPGVVFGRWKMVRIDLQNIAMYRRGGAKGRGAWMTAANYFNDAGAALRYAMKQDANDAVAVSDDASKLLAKWDAMMERSGSVSKMLKGRTVPKEEVRL